MLWFDVETRYKTTIESLQSYFNSCGLMQKQDIRQLKGGEIKDNTCCGLMQKQDIRQHYNLLPVLE